MQKVIKLLPGQPDLDRLVTLADLQDFKNELKLELLLALKALIDGHSKQSEKKWLKTWEVRKLLNVSHGTLQTLRDNGTIPFSKIGGIFYYDPADIDREIERRKGMGRNRSGQFMPSR